MIEAATLGTGSDAVIKSNRSQRRTVAQSVFLVALMVLSTMIIYIYIYIYIYMVYIYIYIYIYCSNGLGFR